MTAQSWFHPPLGLALETAALEQVKVLASMDNTLAVAGMPDLHPGKGGPVGMAILGKLPVPAVLGNDLGCGFALFRLDLKAKRLADPAWVAARLNGLDIPLDAEIIQDWSRLDFKTAHDGSLGTIGGGNHFIEVGVVHESISGSPLHEGDGTLLVHTGSRSLGEAVFRQVVAVHRDMPLEDYETWLAQHEQCMRWAACNRALAARRAAGTLGVDLEPILDLPHNFLEMQDAHWLHRKGASPSNRGMSVLPGTRGTPTFLVQPDTLACAQTSLHSLPHGAGRRISRSAARNAGSAAPGASRDSLSLSAGRKGSRVVCGDPDLLLEERPRAYKDVRAVLGGLQAAGLGRQVAEIHPVATFKRSEVEIADQNQDRGRDRTRGHAARQETIARRWERNN